MVRRAYNYDVGAPSCSGVFVAYFVMAVCFPLFCVGTSRPSTGPTPGNDVTLKAANIVSGRYIYLQDLLELAECTEHDCPVKWPVCPTPIRASNWKEFLQSHPDQKFASYIATGLPAGFRIGFARGGSCLRPSLSNHPSAMTNAQAVSDYVAAEVELGRLVGPLKEMLFPLVKTSPIGLVPKSHQVDKWRMIVDLSFPRGGSVNSGISSELSSITYAKVDDAVELILQLGPGTELVKLDLKNAYRMVPVHPEDHHLLAVSWEGKTYVDRALPFGLRSAPKIFSAVADMVSWVLHCAGIRHQLHYLDDFLLLGAPNTDEAAQALAMALRIFEYLGIPVAVHKTEGPSICITFLGILINTVSFELRLPADKLQRLQTLVQSWNTEKAHTRKELESLLGHLSHAASIIRPGRTFLRQLFSLLHQVRAPHHYVRLNAGARADLAWWKCFLQSWSGSSFFPPHEPSFHVYSDASGGFGYGAFVGGLGWFQGLWPGGWENIDISVKELVPVVIAAALWGKHWTSKHVCFHSDNMAVVAILASRTAKTQLLVHLLRCFSFYSAHFGFHYSAKHVPGVRNMAADALSRGKLHVFSSLVPQTPRCVIPPSLVELLITRRPDWGSPAWTHWFVRSLNEVSPSRH